MAGRMRSLLLIAANLLWAQPASADDCRACWRNLCNDEDPAHGAIVATLTALDSANSPPVGSVTIDVVSGELPYEAGDVLVTELVPYNAQPGDRFLWGLGRPEGSDRFLFFVPFTVTDNKFACLGEQPRYPLEKALALAASSDCYDLAEETFGPPECSSGCSASQRATDLGASLTVLAILGTAIAANRRTGRR